MLDTRCPKTKTMTMTLTMSDSDKNHSLVPSEEHTILCISLLTIMHPIPLGPTPSSGQYTDYYYVCPPIIGVRLHFCFPFWFTYTAAMGCIGHKGTCRRVERSHDA